MGRRCSPEASGHSHARTPPSAWDPTAPAPERRSPPRRHRPPIPPPGAAGSPGPEPTASTGATASHDAVGRTADAVAECPPVEDQSPAGAPAAESAVPGRPLGADDVQPVAGATDLQRGCRDRLTAVRGPRRPCRPGERPAPHGGLLPAAGHDQVAVDAGHRRRRGQDSAAAPERREARRAPRGVDRRTGVPERPIGPDGKVDPRAVRADGRRATDQARGDPLEGTESAGDRGRRLPVPPARSTNV
jgi:hypothetical protein